MHSTSSETNMSSKNKAVAPAPMMTSKSTSETKGSFPRRRASTGTLVVLAPPADRSAASSSSSFRLPHNNNASLLRNAKVKDQLSISLPGGSCASVPSLYVPLKSCLSTSNLEEALYSSSHSPLQQQHQPRATVRKNVSFHTIEIREHRRALGDNPSVSQGPALSLDWESCEAGACSVDDYERHRPPRRCKSELAVPREIRERILRHEAGVSRGEMAAANRQTEKIRQSRRKHSHDHEFGAIGRPLHAIKKLWKSGETKATARQVEDLLQQSRRAEQVQEQQRQEYLALLMEQLTAQDKASREEKQAEDELKSGEEMQAQENGEEQHQEAGQATQEEEKKQQLDNSTVKADGEPTSGRHLFQKEDRKPSFMPIVDVDDKMQDVSEEWEF